MNNGLISIVIPTFNRAHLIAETLNSILEQSYGIWECIIIDDNSTDYTIEVVTSFLKDDRFKFFVKPNQYLKGANGSRNFGLDLSKGEYLFWFDSDDIIHPFTFELCMNEFKQNSIDFCRFRRTVFYDNFDYKKFDDFVIDENKFFIDKTHVEKIINNELPFNTCNLMWKKKSLGSERFSDQLLYAEEWEYYSRLVSNSLRGVSINKILIYARKHSESQTNEFYSKDVRRVQATNDAALLIVKNLAFKNMLTKSLKRYFIIFSVSYKEYNLFEQIMEAMQLSSIENIKWRFFYKILPLRIYGYRIKKRILKKL